jgi:hypothetical protein
MIIPETRSVPIRAKPPAMGVGLACRLCGFDPGKSISFKRDASFKPMNAKNIISIRDTRMAKNNETEGEKVGSINEPLVSY